MERARERGMWYVWVVGGVVEVLRSLMGRVGVLAEGLDGRFWCWGRVGRHIIVVVEG